jgi:hypothetical protein
MVPPLHKYKSFRKGFYTAKFHLKFLSSFSLPLSHGHGHGLSHVIVAPWQKNSYPLQLLRMRLDFEHENKFLLSDVIVSHISESVLYIWWL